jgi:hypothetical protein
LGFLPWNDDSPSDEICPCCFIQFGCDDATESRNAVYDQWRKRWIAGGMKWLSKSRKPPNGWEPKQQLKRVYEIGQGALDRNLTEIAELLNKYQHYAQARVVEEILATLETSNPDYKRLCGIDMWGGAGAVWEVYLSSSQESDKADQQALWRAFVRLVETMNQMDISTDRSRFLGTTLQKWLDKGL